MSPLHSAEPHRVTLHEGRTIDAEDVVAGVTGHLALPPQIVQRLRGRLLAAKGVEVERATGVTRKRRP
jgi:hypothetical protein